MVYRRRYGTRTRRYNGRKYRMSKYNLYRKRSSTQQALQIYRLNKKVNRIEYKTKPEIKIYNHVIQNSVGELCNYTFGAVTPLSSFINTIQGRLCRIQDIGIWFTQFMSPSATNITHTTTTRIVIYQLRAGSADLPSTPESIFNITQQERQETNVTLRKRAFMKAIFGPLKAGISSEFKILRDFKISISGQNQQRRCKRVKIKKGMSHIEKDPKFSYPKGYIGYLAITSSNNSNGTALDVDLLSNVKIAYVDES